MKKNYLLITVITLFSLSSFALRRKPGHNSVSTAVVKMNTVSFSTMPCEELIEGNLDTTMNVEIATYCKKMWETNEALDFGGSPKGTYIGHTYNGKKPIQKDEMGNITGMGIYVNVVVKLKKDGSCKVATVKFIKEYQGGASYGDLSRPFVFGDTKKIDCACAEKLTKWITE